MILRRGALTLRALRYTSNGRTRFQYEINRRGAQMEPARDGPFDTAEQALTAGKKHELWQKETSK